MTSFWSVDHTKVLNDFRRLVWQAWRGRELWEWSGAGGVSANECHLHTTLISSLTEEILMALGHALLATTCNIALKS